MKEAVVWGGGGLLIGALTAYVFGSLPDPLGWVGLVVLVLVIVVFQWQRYRSRERE